MFMHIDHNTLSVKNENIQNNAKISGILFATTFCTKKCVTTFVSVPPDFVSAWDATSGSTRGLCESSF